MPDNVIDIDTLSKLREQNRMLLDEIKELKEEKVILRDGAALSFDDNKELRATNERLRAEIDSCSRCKVLENQLSNAHKAMANHGILN